MNFQVITNEVFVFLASISILTSAIGTGIINGGQA